MSAVSCHLKVKPRLKVKPIKTRQQSRPKGPIKP